MSEERVERAWRMGTDGQQASFGATGWPNTREGTHTPTSPHTPTVRRRGTAPCVAVHAGMPPPREMPLSVCLSKHDCCFNRD